MPAPIPAFALVEREVGGDAAGGEVGVIEIVRVSACTEEVDESVGEGCVFGEGVWVWVWGEDSEGEEEGISWDWSGVEVVGELAGIREEVVSAPKG